MQPIIASLIKVDPRASVSTWVGDIGADLEDADVPRLARRTVCFAHALMRRLQDSQLCVSLKKSGILCSSASLAKAVKQQLRLRCCELAVCHWLRDLGSTATAARLRRTAMQQKRWALAKKRAARLRHLPQSVAGRMLRANILPKAFWGHCHSGVSGNNLHRCRSHLGRVSCLLKKHGDVEVAFAMSFDRHCDPAYRLRIEQVKTWIKLFQATPEVRRRLLSKAWEIREKLTKRKKPWLVVRGPMAATQMTLFELGWSAPSCACWVDPGGVRHCLDYSDPALSVEVGAWMLGSVESFLWLRAGKHQAAEGLNGRRPDLTIACKRRKWLLQHQPHRVAFHDMLVQGALVTRVDLLHREDDCPACGAAPDTLHHRLWECPKLNMSYPQEWAVHMREREQRCFWLRGLVPASWAVDVRVGSEDMHVDGVLDQPWPVTLPEGACICLDGSGGPGPGTKDPRIRKCAWAFVVLVGPPHAPEIVGSAVGNLVGDKQSVPRAELTALVKALQATSGELKLCTDAAYVQRVFRKCRQPRFIPQCHWDLWTYVKQAQRERALVLHKIKSHLSEYTFRAQYHQELWWMWPGNSRADAALIFDQDVLGPRLG